jgi:hypothetical protein
MADLHVHRDRLEIHLTPTERLLSLRRDDIVVRREDIRSVAITEDSWIWIRGVRAPGTIVPLTLAVGTWKFHGGKDFLLLKGKNRAAVVIDLDVDAEPSTEFARVIVSTTHATRLVEALRVLGPDVDQPGGELID